MKAGDGVKGKNLGGAVFGVSLIILGIILLGVQFSPAFADHPEPAPFDREYNKACSEDPEPFDSYQDYTPDVVDLLSPSRSTFVQVRHEIHHNLQSELASALRDVHIALNDAETGLRDAHIAIRDGRRSIHDAHDTFRSTFRQNIRQNFRTFGRTIRNTVRIAGRTIRNAVRFAVRTVFRDGIRSVLRSLHGHDKDKDDSQIIIRIATPPRVVVLHHPAEEI